MKNKEKFVATHNVISRGGVHICDVEGDFTTVHEDEETAERIVACLNACAGIENPEELRRQRDELRDAIGKIARWDLPETGKTWGDGSPMSYGAAFGSNGERDYIRSIANIVLDKIKEAA